ncbi:MAG: succinate dehydrogenase cytochrome b558 subunit [Pirellulaceae bacterium]
MQPTAQASFLARHEFLIRRLHSLSGLIPVGAYMVVHLTTNASVVEGPAAFQRLVYKIHSLGAILPLVEWGFIFLPLLFHAIFGLVIIRGGLPNNSSYRYSGNVRYFLQRLTGMIAFAFIMWHVFHMHGWFHNEQWLANVAEPLNGAQFRPYNAASTAGEAVQASPLITVLYGIGVLACVYHLANGLWTMGITWGVWISPAAQRRANYACAIFGVLLAVVGLSSLVGMNRIDVEAAREVENQMYEARVSTGEVTPNDHKRSGEDHESEQMTAAASQQDARNLTRGETN